MKKPQDSTVSDELMTMFTLGRDMSAVRWMERLCKDAGFLSSAQKLIWQTGGHRFSLDGKTCRLADGRVFTPDNPVGLAHPVLLNADEILFWRGWLNKAGIHQPFRQMWEPVVLKDGRLPGRIRCVQSAGESYKMLDRYRHFHLPLNAMTELEKHGFRFVSRQRWDRNQWRMAEIKVVNIVTPAGIFYECALDERTDSLSAKSSASLILNMFHPFEGIRLCTLNHVAAALEEHLIPEFIERDALEMLLPHLPGMSVERLKELLQACNESGETAALLRRLIKRKEEGAC